MSPTKLRLNLSVEINTAYFDAQAAAAAARTAVNDAVRCAVECGQLLIEQKAALRHGDWQTWLLQHCPQISASTARRYMRLSQRTHGAGFLDARGLRQAYLATGVIPAEKPCRYVLPKRTSFVTGLDQFRRWFHAQIEIRPLQTWTPDARRVIRNELVWFVRLHDALR